MTQKELCNLGLAFVRDELPFQFEDCIGSGLDKFPEHLQVSGKLSDYEGEGLVYSDHYYKHIKEYLLDFVVGKDFLKVRALPNTSIESEKTACCLMSVGFGNITQNTNQYISNFIKQVRHREDPALTQRMW